MTTLYIIRGLPGSGKTTRAKELIAEHPGLRHVEADMYFEDNNGYYRFIASKVKDAHVWCRKKVAYLLELGHDVVVSNTFTQVWEMQPYFDMAKATWAEVVVIECDASYQNKHGVPAEHVEKMRSRWEPLP